MDIDTEICRFCLLKASYYEGSLKNIFEESELADKIKKLLGIKIVDNDKSKFICIECSDKIQSMLSFVQKCRCIDALMQHKDLSEIDLQEENLKEFPSKNDMTEEILLPMKERRREETNECIQNLDHEETSNETISDQEKISCKICNYLIFPKNMASHLILHTDVYKCKKCGIRHSSRYSLDQHLKLYHGDLRNYVCNFCGLRSTSLLTINRHLNSHTFSANIHKCKSCPYKTIDPSKMNHHFMMHSKNLCLIKRTFSRRNSSTRFVKQIGPRNTSFFVCTVYTNERGVTKNFENEYYIIKRVTYQCTKCKKTFSSKAGLTRHTKSYCGTMFAANKFLFNRRGLDTNRNIFQ